MKHILITLMVVVLLIASVGLAEGTDSEATEEMGFFEGIGNWISNAANDAWSWTSNAATDAWNWVSGAASDAWTWSSDAVSTAWNGVTEFFSPPDTKGIPNLPAEPNLPEGVRKMYLGYGTRKTGLDNGYSNTLEIGKSDPHYGWELGRFYVSGFSEAKSADWEHFTFLKTVGDNLELHFELAQDIDMLNSDKHLTINADMGGYDKEYGIPMTDFGRGCLVVYFTDYQNNRHERVMYTDFLKAKMNGKADTVISLNEEGDYEVILDYEIKQDKYTLGTSIINSSFHDYKLAFTFSVRNGNCMIFPMNCVTGEELKNTAVVEDGFMLDLAYSRFLEINVKRSVLTEGPGGLVEDIRFNRPAKDGDRYTDEGIYTIDVYNQYTGEKTTKVIYVGSDERLMKYVSDGYSVEQIIKDEKKQ